MARYFLLQQTPGNTGSRIRLDGLVLIGRESDCRVILQDDLVSRHHAQVSMVGIRPYLKDLGSTNGTTMNGVRVRETALRGPRVAAAGRSVAAA